MPRRSILTARQRAALFDLPTYEASILYHYTLSDEDIEVIRTRRHARNRLGFALQLCAFRYPGRLLVSGEVIPEAVSRFIAAQVGEEMDELCRYAETDVTRRRHLVDLRQIYGFKMFSGHPRQHELAVALREIGRVERTLFIIEWLLDADMQRRAQIGLNKGEAHHALKNALRIGRQGEIRDRTAEGQHYRMAGLNLLATIIIYWNTKHLGQAVAARRRAGLNCAPDLLAHISPLGWAHILLIGEYRWRRQTGVKL